jgi:hypothetical protein
VSPGVFVVWRGEYHSALALLPPPLLPRHWPPRVRIKPGVYSLCPRRLSLAAKHFAPLPFGTALLNLADPTPPLVLSLFAGLTHALVVVRIEWFNRRDRNADSERSSRNESAKHWVPPHARLAIASGPNTVAINLPPVL